MAIKMLQIPKDLIHKTILRTGPIIAGTRTIRFNKKTKTWEHDKNSRGSVTNYDRKVFHWKTDKERDEIIEREKCRWHYFKSFEPYGFKPEEWE
jgi:hypothetical protein